MIDSGQSPSSSSARSLGWSTPSPTSASAYVATALESMPQCAAIQPLSRSTFESLGAATGSALSEGFSCSSSTPASATYLPEGQRES